jgi:hypothetical protein
LRASTAILLASAFAVAAAVVLAAVLLTRPPEIKETWNIYVQSLSPQSKILALTSTQRYTASKEFTAKLLAVVRLKASIELEAWADVHYVVDASDPEAWSFAWDRKSKTLTVKAPAPDCLPPAVKTETIEIRAKGSNLLTNTVFRLREEAAKMEAELSADLLRQAKATLADPEIRRGVARGIEGVAAAFCASALKIKPATIAVVLGQ